MTQWLRIPRPSTPAAVWRVGHEARPAQALERTPWRRLVGGAFVSFLVGWLVWSLLYNGYLGQVWLLPVVVLVPDAWRGTWGFVLSTWVYYAVVIAALAYLFGRIGRWPELLRRLKELLFRLDSPGTRSAVPAPRQPAPLPAEEDPATWPQVRAGGAPEAADRLAEELQAGRMTDVDHARISRAWETVRAQPQRLSAFGERVRLQGAAAFAHSSGERDLPARTAEHDLVLNQVRVGTGVDADRNPADYRGAGIALDPGVLGTSALVVGPAGSRKTVGVVRPVVESLCLQALGGQAAVVVVTERGERLAADAHFDVVVSLRSGDGMVEGPRMDLYGGCEDPDEAAGVLAEALVGDLTESLPGGDSRRAATALAQLIGPYRAVHGMFPSVAELHELLDGGGLLQELRAALEGKGLSEQVRELDAFVRQSECAALLGDRVALLDRPVFAGVFGREAPTVALDRPLRVRVDLPGRTHASAGRILARLVLAQFMEAAGRRAEESLFAFLVVDDAAQTVTPESLRSLQSLQGAHAGVLLTLRGLTDVPAALRERLLGAVGCRVACAGISPWDAGCFADVWGSEWVETRSVTNRQLVSEQPMTKAMHALRRFTTGRYVTAESVTVRQERRQRWSADELATELPPGHVVLSVTSAEGERTSPVLTQLT